MDTSSRRSTQTIALCFIIALIEGFDLQSAGTTAAGIRQTFALDPSMLGWVFSVSVMGLLPGAFLGGWVADRVGRKRVLMVAVTLFGVFSLLTAHVDSYSHLLLVRLMTGLGLGAALPNLIALCAESAGEARRSTAISIMYAGVPLGGALAALLAMFTHDHWQLTFIVGGLAPLLAVPLMWVMLPESNVFQRPDPSIARISTGSALFGDGRGSATLSLWLGYFFTLMVMYMLLNWLPSLLIGQGFNKSEAGLVQMVFNIGGAIGSLLGGVLFDRYSKVQVVLVAYAGLLAALGGLGLSKGLLAMTIFGFAAGLFVIGAQLLLYALTPPLYHATVRATGVGAAVAVGRLGSVVGPLVAGQILAAGASTAGVLLAASPGVGVAALCILHVLKRTAVVAPRTPS